MTSTEVYNLKKQTFFIQIMGQIPIPTKKDDIIKLSHKVAFIIESLYTTILPNTEVSLDDLMHRISTFPPKDPKILLVIHHTAEMLVIHQSASRLSESTEVDPPKLTPPIWFKTLVQPEVAYQELFSSVKSALSQEFLDRQKPEQLLMLQEALAFIVQTYYEEKWPEYTLKLKEIENDIKQLQDCKISKYLNDEIIRTLTIRRDAAESEKDKLQAKNVLSLMQSHQSLLQKVYYANDKAAPIGGVPEEFIPTWFSGKA